MAGEIVVHPFDRARYEEIGDALRGLVSTRRLGDAGLAVVGEFAARVAPSPVATGLMALTRVAAAPALDPRTFLTPRELDAAVEALVIGECLAGRGAFSLVHEFGPTWLVLDAAQRELRGHGWFERVFWDAEGELVEPLPIPEHGEDQLRQVTRAGLELLAESLASLASGSFRQDGTREAVATLRRFTMDALAARQRSIVFRSLL